MANKKPPSAVLKLIADAIKRSDAAKLRKAAKKPTVANRIKLRKAAPGDK